MNNRNFISITILLALGLLAFAATPNSFGVVPAPDGGYPNFTTAEGTNALKNLTTGSGNTGIGWFSLFTASTANFNTGVGAGTLTLNTGDNNTAMGAVALFLNTTGANNTAVGAAALLKNADGFFNTATGSGALQDNDIGAGNTAIGYFALHNNVTGGGNIAIGVGAGTNITGGDNNIYIGNVGGVGDSNTTRIGIAKTTQRTFIDGIRGVTTGFNDAVNVVIDSAGQLGTVSSSRRFKMDIKPMDDASGSILALKPVTFRYRSQKDAKPQFGLIAEEVAEVNPDLVVRDENGEIYTVRYEAVNAMLLNEFLKEHATVQLLKKEIAILKAGLQKVSAEIETNRPEPRVASNRD